MSIGVKHVHIGREIDKRRLELGISKSELGRRIHVPQQHINRILEKETIDTGKLIDISVALEKNFFDLYASDTHNVSAYLAAVSIHGDANNMIGESEVASELSQTKVVLEEKTRAFKFSLTRSNVWRNHLRIKHSSYPSIRRRWVNP